MKTVTLLLALLFFAFTSCNNIPSKNTDSQTVIPLQDDDNDDSIIKNSRGPDMLSDIYHNQVMKRSDLHNLEDLIDHFNEGMPDSLKNFERYARQSDFYYRSANTALTHMGDTVFRERLRSLLNESRHKYLDTIKRFSVLMAHIDSNKIKIEDYHTLLKIVTTLPIIEKYQFQNQPDIKSIANLANEAQRLKAKTIQLASKH